MKSILLSALILVMSLPCISQTIPSFNKEIDVTISGLTFDAMEPFISSNGSYLFFNSLNDGINTKLYYATKANDSTFNFVGEINGANQPTSPQLNAVADLDSLNNFYWTSTRNYPSVLDNLFYGSFNGGIVSNIGRVRGSFNKNIPGWLVMDHGISIDGQLLYYNNARFDGSNCQGPCETEIGIAQKINDSTFNKTANSDIILQNINDTNFIYYAPCISSDNLEFYYTRFAKGTITPNTTFEICVAVRNTPSSIFSTPSVLFSETISNLIEAPTLTTDKQVMYYHKKIPSSHKIVMRYRDNTLSTNTFIRKENPITIYPNPTNEFLNIKTELNYQNIKLTISSLLGKELISITNQLQVNINSIPSGSYLLKIEIDEVTEIMRFIRID